MTAKYIDEFVEPSKPHEALFVGHLWSTPSLYEKYSTNKIIKTTFTEPQWYFYYYVGREMYNNGIKSFDDVSTYAFLSSRSTKSDKKSWLDIYNNYGGFSPIEDLLIECQKKESNHEYHFSEIQKYECLRKFQDENLINVSNKDLVSKLAKMSLKQLQAFFQHKTNKIFVNVSSGEVVEYNLLDDLDVAIKKMNDGEGMGLILHDSPRLSKRIKGWKKGQLYYLVLSSGVGKSSIATEKFALSLLENDEKGIMFANEENVWKTRNLMLATVASKLLNKPINREKLAEGNFDDKTMAKLLEAKQKLEQYNKEIIKFYDMKKYRIEDIITRCNIMKPLGYNYAIVDTFKPDSSSSELQRWERFAAASQNIFDCIKPEANNIGMLATVQLKIGKEYRYLDLDVIGKSKEIVEVADVVMIGRLLFEDEYEGKHKIFAYNWVKDDFDGEWRREEYKLDPEKTYLILFLPKNRNGSTEEQIIYEVNYSINSFKEVAWAKLRKTTGSYF
jgi:hypothetical protein